MVKVLPLKRLAPAFAVLALSTTALTLSTTAVASGSFGGGSSAGFQSSYNLGKSVFYKKLGCDTCELKGASLDKSEAKNVIQKLSNDAKYVSEIKGKERKAVISYMSRRYKAG